jgi:hypothetical protein
MTDGLAHVNRAKNVWLCQYSGRLVQLSREAFGLYSGARGVRGLILALRLHGMKNGHEEESHIVLPLAVSYHLCIISPTAAGQGERVYFE